MFQLALLNDELYFPPLKEAHSSGLLAAGGDLSVNRLILAYHSGIFPWFNTHDPFLWWSPDPRFVLFTEEFKLSKRQERYIRKANFYITANTAFTDVMKYCACVPRKKPSSLEKDNGDKNNNDDDTQGTWITPSMIDAYEKLFQAGFAHSVEVWQEVCQEDKEEIANLCPSNNSNVRWVARKPNYNKNLWKDGGLGEENKIINKHTLVRNKIKYQLVGGLYGVRMGHIFCGESMFHIVPEASRAALQFLINAMKKHNMPLLDSQQETPHMQRVGGRNISRKEYLKILQKGLDTHDTAHERAFL